MYFRKVRGWSGRTYYVQMTPQEIEAKRKLELIVGVPVVMTVMAVLSCLCAGII